MKTNLRIGEVLMERNYITQEQMEQALAYQKEHREKRVGQILIELGFVTEAQVLEALAARLGLEIVSIGQMQVDLTAVRMIPRELAEKQNLLAVGFADKSLEVVTNDPLNYFAFEEVRQLTGCQVVIRLSEMGPLQSAIRYYYAEVGAQQAAQNANEDFAERNVEMLQVEESEYVNIRVSLLPTVFGEKAVLRILATAGQVDYASHFGMDDESYARFLPMLNSPNGIIYITGPTGSGKSTTLYMVLEYLSHRQVNISTVEDPVEKNVPSINQTQVNPVAGLTFESGLRALLRQDPDIIMVGETRDGETAGISVRAAITGHLVLSTLHTNDAVSSIVRLADMGIDHYLIANSLVGLVAQRLMRKVCLHCGREVAVTPQEQALLGKDITTIKRGTGCAHCNGTGYRGRIAVHEIVMIDRNIRRMISRGAETEEIEAYAREQQGMRSLKEKGLELVKQGVTTPEELLRIAYYA